MVRDVIPFNYVSMSLFAFKKFSTDYFPLKILRIRMIIPAYKAAIKAAICSILLRMIRVISSFRREIKRLISGTD